MTRIGRNDPCPCGSGKKYKKCCYEKSISTNTSKLKNKNHILPAYDKIDYGKPILDEHFFETNTVHELSAPRFLYSILLTPEVENLASEITNRILDRGKKERKIIENTEDVKLLIHMMNKRVDPLNHVLLQDKLLRYKETSIPMIIEELKKPKAASFVEIAIKIIHASGVNYSKEIIEIIKYNQISAYAVSQLCMLLGFYENKNSEKLLWDYYHYFKENISDKTYCDGPLLGLIEMRERRKEKI